MATEEDKTNSGALLTLVFVSAFAMIAVTLAVTAIARDEMSKAQEEKQGPGAGQYHELRRSQLGSLSNGTSIAESMQNVVQGLARDPSSATPPLPASAAPVAPAATDGTQAAGGAPSAGQARAAVAGASAAPAAVPGTPAAPQKPAPTEQKSKPPAPDAKPLAPKPASGQPSPAAPPTPAPPPPAHG